METRGPVTLTS
jgi:hypothetical protein